MSENKRTVERYIEGFNRSDHALILACLTDDVVWELPGAFHLVGKEQFDQEIENPAFMGSPVVVVTRMVEENDVVVAEGTVRARRNDGVYLNLAMCDLFEMREAKIARVVSYLAEMK